MSLEELRICKMLKHNKGMIKALKGKKFGSEAYKQSFLAEVNKQILKSLQNKIKKKQLTVIE